MSVGVSGPAVAKLTRRVVAIHVFLLAAHITAALAFISGMVAALAAHSNIAWVLLVLGILQALLIINSGIPRISRMYTAFAVAVALGEMFQLFVIPPGEWLIHVTVAMVVWGCSLAIYIRLLDPQWLPVASGQAG